MFGNLEFFLVEALRSLRRGALMSMVAVGTITVALVVFGIFLLLVINLGNMVGTVSSKLDIAAYVEKELSLKEAGALQIELSKIEGVEKVEYISAEDAWKKFKEEFGSKLNLEELIRNNPLPHAFTIKVRTAELLPSVAQKISAIEIINEVRYSGRLIDQIKSLVNAVRIGGFSLTLLLALATLLIVVNTIRLTVLARETDIYIMRLVGATNSFIKGPFIIEGILIGILGGIASSLILKFSYEAVVVRIIKALPFLPVVTDQGLLTGIYIVVVLGGTALGLLGGYISVSRVLKE